MNPPPRLPSPLPTLPAVYELPTAVVKDRAALLALKAVVANPPAGMTDTWAEGTNPCLPKWDFIEVRREHGREGDGWDR